MTVLRLLSADRSVPRGGAVTYLAQLAPNLGGQAAAAGGRQLLDDIPGVDLHHADAATA